MSEDKEEDNETTPPAPSHDAPGDLPSSSSDEDSSDDEVKVYVGCVWTRCCMCLHALQYYMPSCWR